MPVIADEVRPAKPRWGELDEEDGDLDFLLPPNEVIGPDENVVKKVIEYKFNDEGRKVKITTTVRTQKFARARLSKQAVERRSWVKFGDAVKENACESRTLVSIEEIHLERPEALVMKSRKTICFCIPAWKPKEGNDQEKHDDDESHSSSRRWRGKRRGHVVSTAHNDDHGEGNTDAAGTTAASSTGVGAAAVVMVSTANISSMDGGDGGSAHGGAGEGGGGAGEG